MNYEVIRDLVDQETLKFAVHILILGTDKSEQTVQIWLFQQEQCNKGQHCLVFRLSLLEIGGITLL